MIDNRKSDSTYRVQTDIKGPKYVNKFVEDCRNQNKKEATLLREIIREHYDRKEREIR